MRNLLEDLLKVDKHLYTNGLPVGRLPIRGLIKETNQEDINEFPSEETSNDLPTGLATPSYLLNTPFSYSTREANNVWMKKLGSNNRKIDLDKAIKQFMDLYHFLAAGAFVQVLPTPRDTDLQDLVFVANLGIVLEHIPTKDVAIISNFTSEPRKGETPVGVKFFEFMGYKVVVSPHKFEGEAELKYLHDNIYIGGYGIRSDKKAYEWMEKEFDMKIIKVLEKDEYLYHLDCTIFPITKEKTIVCTEAFDKEEVKEIEKHTEIVDVSIDNCYSGICNSVRLWNMILNSSNIGDLKPGTEEYKIELNKNRKLQDITTELGFEVVFFNLSEYLKGGAVLSCMIMHLNRNSYKIDLV